MIGPSAAALHAPVVWQQHVVDGLKRVLDVAKYLPIVKCLKIAYKYTCSYLLNILNMILRTCCQEICTTVQ